MLKRLGFDSDRHWDIALAAGIAFLGLYDLLSAFCMGAFRDPTLVMEMLLGFLLKFFLPTFCLILLIATASKLWQPRQHIGKAEWALRILVLTMLAILSVGEWTGLPWYALARGTRWRIEREIPLAEFQRWVVGLNRDDGSNMPDRLLDAGQFHSCVPEAVRRTVNPEENYLSLSIDEIPEARGAQSLGSEFPPGMGIVVRITYGGGFLHWGAVIGPPGFISRREGHRIYRWADGVYGFVE